MRFLRGWLMLLLVVPGCAGAQTLARKNWAGSGMSTQLWWSRAIFCRIDLRPTGATLKQAAAELDRMQAMGCDAVELGVLTPPAGTNLIDAKFGTLEEADELLEGVVHRKMRLVLDLPMPTAQTQDATVARMRLWLSRGVAGFVLEGAGTADPVLLKALRQVIVSALGPRVLIGDGLGLQPLGRNGSSDDVQMVVRRVSGNVAGLRSGLSSAMDGGRPAVIAHTPVDAAKVWSALVLLHGAAAELPVTLSQQPPAPLREFSADELRLWVPRGDPSLVQAEQATQAVVTAWIAALADLHHGSEALRSGTPVYLNRDGQDALVWLVRSRAGVLPVLVVCNLSEKPLKVGLREEVKALNVKGSFLHTILRSDTGGKYATLDDIEIPGGAVFVGDIR